MLCPWLSLFFIKHVSSLPKIKFHYRKIINVTHALYKTTLSILKSVYITFSIFIFTAALRVVWICACPLSTETVARYLSKHTRATCYRTAPPHIFAPTFTIAFWCCACVRCAPFWWSLQACIIISEARWL